MNMISGTVFVNGMITIGEQGSTGTMMMEGGSVETTGDLNLGRRLHEEFPTMGTATITGGTLIIGGTIKFGNIDDPNIHRSPGGDGTELGNGLKRYKKHYFDKDQLYNLKKDPGETKNLANDPEHKQQLEKMKAELKKHLLGVPGTFAEFK